MLEFRGPEIHALLKDYSHEMKGQGVGRRKIGLTFTERLSELGKGEKEG